MSKTEPPTSETLGSSASSTDRPPPRAAASETSANLAELHQLFEASGATGLKEFVAFMRSPLRVFWANFLMGVARGFGTLIGASIVVAIVGWVIAQLVDFPIIGKYFQTAQGILTEYVTQTNYHEELTTITHATEEIRDHLRNFEANASAPTPSAPPPRPPIPAR